jgi:GAF domain-containing protein
MSLDDTARLQDACDATATNDIIAAGFDAIARRAADHFRVPAALVWILDGHEQHVLGRWGVPWTGTPASALFCRCAAGSDDVLVVEDARQDDRFAGSAAAPGEGGIRFYAGAPLLAFDDPDLRLGAVAIMDHRPRFLTFGERIYLKQLAAAASAEFERSRGPACPSGGSI